MFAGADLGHIAFIGDVHGWSDRLDRLLGKIGDAPHLVFMGDLIDRGPDAPGVLERVHQLCTAGRAHCLLGNHEYALLHALGSPELGLPGNPRMFQAWQRSFGGDAVLRAFGLRVDDSAGLRNALASHRVWLASLPWILDGRCAQRTWIAVHAGLGPQRLQTQVDALRQGWLHDDGHPAALFDKSRSLQIPCDLPEGCCVVSGHTPLAQALVQPQRILCDTSGGMPGRNLTAVIYPTMEVLVSA
jgi:hypothetical protein